MPTGREGGRPPMPGGPNFANKYGGYNSGPGGNQFGGGSNRQSMTQYPASL